MTLHYRPYLQRKGPFVTACGLEFPQFENTTVDVGLFKAKSEHCMNCNRTMKVKLAWNRYRNGQSPQDVRGRIKK